MGKTVEIGIRISLDGNKQAADGIDQITASELKLGATAEQVSQQISAAQQQTAKATADASQAQQQFIVSMRDEVQSVGAGKAGLQQLQSAQSALASSTSEMGAATARAAQAQAASNGQMNDTAQLMRAQAAAARAAEESSNKFLASLRNEIALFGANRAETERLNAAKAGLGAAAQRQAAALGATIDALHRDEAASRAAAAAEDRATQAADQFIKKLQDQVAVLGMNSQQLQTYRAAQLGVADAAAPLIAQLAETGKGAHGAGGHMEGFSFKTAAAKRELLVLAHELSQGQFQRFGGSMMVLGEQTGAASMLFSAAGLAVLAFGAAVVGVAYSVFKGASDQKHMNDALLATGNYAGVTSDRLNDLAHAAVSAGGSIGKAKEAAIELAASGKFTGDQIGYITEAVVAWEYATGASIKKQIKEFESLAVQSTGSTNRATEVITKATIKLDDTYHFLTLSIYENIRALEKEGDAKGASAVATKAFADATIEAANKSKAEMGNFAKFWHALKEEIAGASDAIGNWGKKVTPAIAVDNLTKEIDRLKKAKDDMNAVNGGSQGGMREQQIDDKLAVAKKALVVAQKELNAANAKAAEEGATAVRNSQAVHAASMIHAEDIRLQKKGMSELAVSLAEYQENLDKIRAVDPKSPLLAPEAIAAGIAARKKAHTEEQKGEDDRAKRLANALTVEQTALDRERGIYDSREKMLTLFHTKFGMSDAAYYEGRATARAEFIAAEANSFARESALIKGFQTQNPREVEANKEKYSALLKQHLKFVDDMRAAGGADDVSVLADEKKAYDGIIKSIQDTGVAESKRLDDAIAKQVQHNAEIGKTKEQIELARQAAVDLETQQMVGDATFLRDAIAKEEFDDKALAAYTMRLAFLDSEIAKRQNLSGLLAQGAQLEAADAITKGNDKYMKGAADRAIQDWQRAGTSIADSLSSAFGSGGKALGSMFKAYSEGVAGQLRAQKDLAAAKKLADTDPEKVKAVERAQLSGAQSQIKSYGDMAGAAQGFFKEGSKGYQAMAAAAQVMHAAEVALTIVKGINAVLTQGEGDPYSAFARMAAMTALVVGLGVAISGGGGGSGPDTTAKDRQAKAGTGSVLGDESAKSESVSRSIENLEQYASIELSHTRDMLSALVKIRDTIGVVAAMATQTSGLRATALDEKKYGVGTSSGFLGIGASSTSIQDSGIKLNGNQTIGSAISSGIDASGYADITKKNSGLWGLGSSSKTSRDTIALDDDLKKQFGMLVESMRDGTLEAVKIFGISTDGIVEKINAMSLGINEISFKDMTGTEIEKELEAVFSKVGDDIAKLAAPELVKFQQVGEGYFETLTRVATNYATLNSILESSGVTFGAVGLSSVAARESFIKLAGGLDALSENTQSFNDNFLTKAEKLAPVQKYVTDQLAAMGLQSLDTRDKFKEYMLGIADSGALLNTDSPITVAGQQQYVALLALSDAFAKTHAATEDLTMSEQEIADQRKDLQSQYDALTMTSAQLREKEAVTIDATNKALWTKIQNEKAAKEAAATNSAMLANMATYYEAVGNKVGQADIASKQWLQTLLDMDPALRASATLAHNAQLAQKAAADQTAENTSMWSSMATIAEVTKDKVSAALVAQWQFNESIKNLSPVAQDWATLAFNAKNKQKELNDAATISNGILANQAAYYEAVSDKAGAAKIAAQQWLVTLANMDPALRESADKAHTAQLAQKAANDATAEANSILSAQATMYKANGDYAGAAAVLEQQHTAALVGMSPALQKATKAMWAAEAAAEALGTQKGIHSTLATDEMKVAEANAKLTKGFAALGMEVPKTVAEFLALSDGASTTTKEGKALIAALDELAPSFSVIQSASQQATKDYEEARKTVVENAAKLLELQAQYYEVTGNAVGAAAVLQKQHTAELLELPPALAEASQALWDAQAAANTVAQAYRRLKDAVKSNEDVARERLDLENELASLTDTAAQALKRQRDAVDASNRALFDSVQAAKAAKAAQEAALETAKTAVEAALQAVQKSIEAEKKRIGVIRDVAAESVQSIKSVFELLKDQVADLYGTVSSTSTMQTAAGNAFIDQALKTALSTGYLPDQDELAKAIAAARGGLDASQFATQFEADKAALVMAGKLAQLQAVSGPQLTTAERSLKAAEDQLTALDVQLDVAQQQVNALTNINADINAGTLSVTEALAKLATAIGVQQALTSPTGAAGNVMAAYSTSDTPGLRAGKVEAQTGVKISSSDSPMVAAAKALYQSVNGGASGAEYNAAQAAVGGNIAQALGWDGTREGLAHLRAEYSFAVGTNYVTRDMVAQLHEGEAVVPKAYNPAAGGIGADTPARLQNVIDALNKKVEFLVAQLPDGDAVQPNAYAPLAGNNDANLTAQLQGVIVKLAEKVESMEKQLGEMNTNMRRTANAVNGNPERVPPVEITKMPAVEVSKMPVTA